MNITVTILVCDEPSPITGRVYPKEEIEKAIQKFKETNRSVFGTSCFESSQDRTFVDILLEDVSHIVTDIWLDGNQVKANITILDTAKGKIIEDILTMDHTLVRFGPTMIGCVDQENKPSKLEFVSVAAYKNNKGEEGCS